MAKEDFLESLQESFNAGKRLISVRVIQDFPFMWSVIAIFDDSSQLVTSFPNEKEANEFVQAVQNIQ